jgi:hypothetical protein
MSKVHTSVRRLAILAIAILLYSQVVIFANDCQKPNPNTVFCQSLPSGAVTHCEQGSIPDCRTHKIYEIKNFPNGAVESSSGLTEQVQAQCIRSKDCGTALDGSGCVVTSYFGGWSNGTKTQVKAGGNCPEG